MGHKTTNLNLINKGNKFAILDGVVGSQFYGYMGPWVHGSMGWVWVLELLEQLEVIGASRAPLGKKRCPRGTPKIHKRKKRALNRAQKKVRTQRKTKFGREPAQS